MEIFYKFILSALIFIVLLLVTKEMAEGWTINACKQEFLEKLDNIGSRACPLTEGYPDVETDNLNLGGCVEYMYVDGSQIYVKFVDEEEERKEITTLCKEPLSGIVEYVGFTENPLAVSKKNEEKYVVYICPGIVSLTDCSGSGINCGENLDIKKLIADAAKRNGVPADLALAIAEVESNFQHCDANGNIKLGKAGEIGLLQIIPDQLIGCSEDALLDINTNIDCAMRLLISKCDVPYKHCKDNPETCDCTISGNCLSSVPSIICTYCPTGGPNPGDKPKPYSGWNIAIRGYNGWGGCGNPFNYGYVENVNSRRPKYIGYN